jgi:hypothetical protein
MVAPFSDGSNGMDVTTDARKPSVMMPQSATNFRLT